MFTKIKPPTEILPCPKCGSKANWFDYQGAGKIFCSNRNCGNSGEIYHLYFDEFDDEIIEDAIKEWNANR